MFVGRLKRGTWLHQAKLVLGTYGKQVEQVNPIILQAQKVRLFLRLTDDWQYP